MRRGFTMIELIFVIVILGILAAVALPKFIGVGQQAHEGNLKAFVGTLNRTVGPTLWSQNIGNGGSIKKESNLAKYVDIPSEIDASTIKFANCGSDFNSSSHFADANTTVTGKAYSIICRDGNATNAPAFQLRNASGNVIAGPES